MTDQWLKPKDPVVPPTLADSYTPTGDSKPKLSSDKEGPQKTLAFLRGLNDANQNETNNPGLAVKAPPELGRLEIQYYRILALQRGRNFSHAQTLMQELLQTLDVDGLSRDVTGYWEVSHP